MAGSEAGERRGRALAGGEFYSQVVSQQRQGHFLLTELRQPTARTLPHHEHQLAYVLMVLDGFYAEQTRQNSMELQAFSAVFNPAGVAHSGLVGRGGTRLFTVECPAPYLQGLDLRPPAYPVVDRGTGAMLWPAIAMFSAFKSETADCLLVESYLLEMLGAASGSGAIDRTVPRWFARVKDRLHCDFRENLRMGDLASEAGVHPVHLARVFRAREGQTPGEYVQRLRIRTACELLRQCETSLAAVALDCGFADQSHFTRTFKRVVGSTPGRLRKLLLPDRRT